MYVRSNSTTTGEVLPPQVRVRGGVRTLQRSASWCPLHTRQATLQKDLVERLLQTLLVHVIHTHVYSQAKQFHNYNQPISGQYLKQVTIPTKLLWQALHHKSLTLPSFLRR
jgi:hypothetical protein